jgi:hypothetical protein
MDISTDELGIEVSHLFKEHDRSAPTFLVSEWNYARGLMTSRSFLKRSTSRWIMQGRKRRDELIVFWEHINSKKFPFVIDSLAKLNL